MRAMSLLLICLGLLACDGAMLEWLTPAVGGEDQRRCEALLEQGQQLFADGAYRLASPRLEAAQACAVSAYGSGSVVLGPYLDALGESLLELDRFPEAEEKFSRALGLHRQALAPDIPASARSLTGLAEAVRKREDFQRAEDLLLEALRLLNTPGVPDSLQALITRRRLVRLYVTQLQFRRAEELGNEALEIAERNGWSEHPEAALVLSTLGNLHKNRGDVDMAAQLLRRAQSLLVAKLGENHPAVTLPMFNLANIAVDQGDCPVAMMLHRRILELRLRAFGERSINYAIAMANLGQAQNSCESETRGEEAIKAAEEIGTDPARKFVVSGIAVSSRLTHASERKDLVEFKHHLGDLHRLQKTLPENWYDFTVYPDYWLAVQENDVPGIVDGLGRWAREFRRQISDSNFVSTEKLIGASAANFCEQNPSIAFALTGRVLRPAVMKASWSIRGACRGVSLSMGQVLSRQVWSLQKKPDSAAFPSLLLDRRNTAQRALRGDGPSLESGVLRVYDPATQRERQLLIEGLGTISGMHNKADERIDIDHGMFGLGNTIIDFVRAKIYPDSGYRTIPAWIKQNVYESHYLAYIVRYDGYIELVDLGPADKIDNLAECVVTNGMLNGKISRLRKLYDLTVGKLRSHLGTPRRLIVMPDGVFNQLPLGILHDGQQFLDEAYVISYAHSAQHMMTWRHAQASTAVRVLADPALSEALAHSDVPVSSRGQAVRSLASSHLHPLSGARAEAERLQSLFSNVQVWQGKEASVRKLFELKPPGILHLAVHGLYLRDARQGPFAEGRSFSPVVSAEGREPALDSMILLADGDSPNSQRQDRPSDGLGGVVTAFEVAALNFWGTQLVVFAACDSGRGASLSGQGVSGMGRAALAAGAESVVTSLWRVDDQVTAQLMMEFYRRLKSGAGRAQALHDAAALVRRTHPHPYYWGAFVLTGNPEPLRGIR